MKALRTVLYLGLFSAFTTGAYAQRLNNAGISKANSNKASSNRASTAKPGYKRTNYQAKNASRSPYNSTTTYASPAVTAEASGGNMTIRKNFLNSNESTAQTVTVTPMAGTYALIGGQVGIKGSVQILDDGFIGPLNDSVSVEVGYFRGSWLDLQLQSFEATMRWDFHLLPAWAVYGAPGFAFEKQWVYINDKKYEPEMRFTIGTSYAFANNFAVRGEYDVFATALRGGVTFKM